MSYIQNLTARNNIKIMFQLPSQDNGKRNVFWVFTIYREN